MTDPIKPSSLSGEIRAVRTTLEEMKAIHAAAEVPSIPKAQAPVPMTTASIPPKRSSHPEAVRWTPAAVGILIAGLSPVIQAWKAPDTKYEEEIKALKTHIEAQDTEIQRLRVLNQEIKDDFSGYRTKSEKWGGYVDASLCVLGVRPPYGCPGVELLPRPMRGSGAAYIQPRVEGVQPLGR